MARISGVLGRELVHARTTIRGEDKPVNSSQQSKKSFLSGGPKNIFPKNGNVKLT
jgi:hypothetical protein